jgi:hypothetical protein
MQQSPSAKHEVPSLLHIQTSQSPPSAWSETVSPGAPERPLQNIFRLLSVPHASLLPQTSPLEHLPSVLIIEHGATQMVSFVLSGFVLHFEPSEQSMVSMQTPPTSHFPWYFESSDVVLVLQAHTKGAVLLSQKYELQSSSAGSHSSPFPFRILDFWQTFSPASPMVQTSSALSHSIIPGSQRNPVLA